MTAQANVEVRYIGEHAEGTRSTILRWLKAEGDAVSENEPLIEIETDKVTVEIAAPAGGVLRQILKHEQQEITPGETLARIEAPDRAPGAAANATPASAPAGNAGGNGQAPTPAPAQTGSASSRTRARAGEDQGVSPAVKRLLEEHGLSAQRVPGSGPGGRITVDDVLEAAAGGGATSNTAVTAAASTSTSTSSSMSAGTPAASKDAGAAVPSHHVTHSATRRRIAERMVASLLHTAPHVTSVFEADFGAVLAHRARYKAEFEAQGTPLTLTTYIVAACVDAIRAVPEVNARWHDESLELFDSIDIGVGTAVEGKGLIVPVLRAVQTLNLKDIAAELARLVDAARDDALTPNDVRGGTFTISNHGVSGSLLAAPIVINQPQVAILGVGKLEKRVAVLEQAGEDKILVRPRAYMSLTIDHRALDGARANRFLQVLVKRLESWPAHN